MKKLLTALALICTGFGVPSLAWTQRTPNPLSSCSSHNPYGLIKSTKPVQSICRQAYLVGYDASAKIPEYVIYQLLPQNALGCIARTNAFVADQSIPNGPTPQDYAGTGYDKGHMSPDGDLSWDQQVEYESFLMTNMVPQSGSFNRGIWKLLETSVRGWVVQKNQTYIIITGSIYNGTDKKIGNGVVVPHEFYKVVINTQTKEVAGWLFPHTAPYPNLGNDLTKYRATIAQIQKEAGVTIPLPKGSVELATGKEWSVDFGALTNAKRSKCG
jgi:endonuclease G